MGTLTTQPNSEMSHAYASLVHLIQCFVNSTPHWAGNLLHARLIVSSLLADLFGSPQSWFNLSALKPLGDVSRSVQFLPLWKHGPKSVSPLHNNFLMRNLRAVVFTVGCTEKLLKKCPCSALIAACAHFLHFFRLLKLDYFTTEGRNIFIVVR